MDKPMDISAILEVLETLAPWQQFVPFSSFPQQFPKDGYGHPTKSLQNLDEFGNMQRKDAHIIPDMCTAGFYMIFLFSLLICNIYIFICIYAIIYILSLFFIVVLGGNPQYERFGWVDLF